MFNLDFVLYFIFYYELIHPFMYVMYSVKRKKRETNFSTTTTQEGISFIHKKHLFFHRDEENR